MYLIGKSETRFVCFFDARWKFATSYKHCVSTKKKNWYSLRTDENTELKKTDKSLDKHVKHKCINVSSIILTYSGLSWPGSISNAYGSLIATIV